MGRRVLLERAVKRSLKSLDLGDQDQAAARLAERYARDLDEAAVISASLTKALRELLQLDPDLHDRFLTLATRIEETAVLAAIGPKLLAALAELGLTPKARSAVMKGGPADGGPRRSPLDELRERRDARANRAPAVDPAAP